MFHDKHVLILFLLISAILELWHCGVSELTRRDQANPSSLSNISSICYWKKKTNEYFLYIAFFFFFLSNFLHHSQRVSWRVYFYVLMFIAVLSPKRACIGTNGQKQCANVSLLPQHCQTDWVAIIMNIQWCHSGIFFFINKGYCFPYITYWLHFFLCVLSVPARVYGMLIFTN